MPVTANTFYTRMVCPSFSVGTQHRRSLVHDFAHKGVFVCKYPFYLEGAYTAVYAPVAPTVVMDVAWIAKAKQLSRVIADHVLSEIRHYLGEERKPTRSQWSVGVENVHQKFDNITHLIHEQKNEGIETTGALLGLTPSAEQQAALDAFAAGNNVCTQAVAGAGKTTLLLMLAAAHPDVEFLVITYNKRLEEESNERIEKYGLRNIKVRTYHGAVGAAYGRIIHNDVKYIAALRTPPPRLGCRALACDALLLDEVQDMTIPYYLFSRMLAPTPTEEKGFGKQVVIVGDENQAINRYKSARVEFLKQHERVFHTGRPWSQCPLTTSFRLTPATATFVNTHVLGANLITGGNVRDPDVPPTYVAVNYGNGAKQRADVIKDRMKRYGIDNVAVIAPSIRSKNPRNPFVICVNEHLGGIPIRKTNDDDKAVNATGELLIATYNSMKGCERDCVIVDCFDENYFEYYEKDWGDRRDVPNILYVSATRARKELVLFADASKTLRSVISDQLHSTTHVMGSLQRQGSSKKQREREMNLSVTDLTRHVSAEILTAAAKHYRAVRKRCVSRPNASVPHHVASFRTAQLRQAGDFTGCFNPDDVYAEPVMYLYGTVIPVLVELGKTGRVTIDELVVPQVLDEKQEVRAISGEITQATLDSYPEVFWPSIEKIREIPVGDRSCEDWFRIAVAKNALRGGDHHIARQVQHYEWIDEQFVYAAVEAVNATLAPLSGKFEVELPTFHYPPINHTGDEAEMDEVKMQRSRINGRADFIEATGDIWEFKCVDKIDDSHLLQLACYLALNSGVSTASGIGHLYAIRSGEIVTITINDGIGLLHLLLDRHETIPEEHDIVEDIEAFKRSLTEGGAADDEPAAPSEPAEDEADAPRCNVDDLF